MSIKALNIWLVEDDYIFKTIFEQQLSKTNRAIELHFFAVASEAINQLSDKDLANFPQLIFLDLEMPEMNGFEFLDVLGKLKIKHTLNICVITSSIDSKDFQKVMQTGLVKNYLIKPVQIHQLKEVINVL